MTNQLGLTHRPIAEEYPVGIHFKDISGRIRCWNNGDLASIGRQTPKDVILNAEVIGHDLQF